MSNDKIPIVISMASHPPRRIGMLRRVDELLPQCTRLRLYLNNYEDDILSQLPASPKLDIILAGKGRKHPDLGSQGKLYGVGTSEDGKSEDHRWLTCDDDIHYPEGYVDYMVEGCAKYEDRCIVTIHGGVFHDLHDGAFGSQPVRDTRVLHVYSRQRDRDMPVHTCGMGITCMRPSVIGLDDSVITGVLGSGDDGDVAVWAQKNEVPIIRLEGRHGWVLPDETMHTVQPLYANTMSVCLEGEKIKAWKKWHYPSLQPTKVKREDSPMFNARLTAEQKDLCHKMLNSDALAALLVDALLSGTPTSVVRMSDGERALMQLSETGETIDFLQDQEWLKKYGLYGADLACVGRRLIQANREATFVASTISGLYLSAFNCFKWSAERKHLISSFYAYELVNSGRIQSIMDVSGGVLVLHRRGPELAQMIYHKYRADARGFVLDSWKDHASLLKEVKQCPHKLVLVSGGASGKPFCVDIARETGKTVLDVGEALTDKIC